MKTCSYCKNELPKSEFYVNKASKDGLTIICRSCCKIKREEYYKKNKDRENQKKKEHVKEYKKWFLDLKSGLSCVKCGEDHPACITFHHVNGKEDKKDTVSNLVAVRSKKETVLKEIEKCIVLCANCHAKEHWKLNRKKKK